MTLRRIHQNISSIKTPLAHPQIHPIPNNNPNTAYDQQEPPHPKMFVESPVKWANSRIKADIDRVGVKTSTAREARMSQVKRAQIGNLTALNTSRRTKFQKFQTIGPSNNNSPRQQQQLFVPQRKKILQHNKLAFMKTTQKTPNTTFISVYKKSLSPQQNQQLTQSKIKEFSRIKLIKPNKTIHHISHLRKYQNQQKQRQTLLNNRLKFITIDNQKDNKKLQMVKRKFEKVVSIRSQSLREKEILSKTKSIIDDEERNYKFSKVSSVKEHQNNRRISMSRLSHNKSMQASILREQEKTIERQIHSIRLTELQKKKQAVRQVQSSLQKSRQRISSLNRSRISSIRSIENKTLIKNYMNVQKRQKINQRLNQTLQKEIKLINQRKLKAASELKQYEDFLGLGTRNNSKEIKLVGKDCKKPTVNSIEIPNNVLKERPKLERAVSSTFSTSGSKSFYLTNC